MARPSTGNYNLGRGILSFKPEGGQNYEDLGNALSFGISVAVETLKHYSARNAMKVVDLEVPVSAEATGTFILDEYDPKNLVMHLFGTLDDDRVAIMTSTSIKGSLKFIGAAGVTPRFIVELYSVTIRPTNPAVFLSDANEFGKLEFAFTIQRSSANPAEPYGYVDLYSPP